MTNPTTALQIPDLRFEQSFMRSVQTNSARKSSKINVEEEKSKVQQDPLPVVITPTIVIYTIIKDQVLMPFIQGFAMTSVLLLLRPILYKIFENGRNFGIRLFSGLGFNNNRNRMYGKKFNQI